MVFQSWNEEPKPDSSQTGMHSSIVPAQTATPGWYPTDVPNQLRYYNGYAWTDDFHTTESADVSNQIVSQEVQTHSEDVGDNSSTELTYGGVDLSSAIAVVTCKKRRDGSRGKAAKTAIGATSGVLALFPDELKFYSSDGQLMLTERLVNITRIKSNPINMFIDSTSQHGFIVEQNMKQAFGAAAIGAAFGVIATSISAKDNNFNEMINIMLNSYPSIKYKRLM